MNNSPKQLSLLSYNTYGIPFIAPAISKRYKKFAQIVQEQSIDVLLLQEVSTYYHLALLKKYLTDYPYLSYKHYFYGPKGGLVIFSKLPLGKSDYRSFVQQGSFTNISFYTKFLQNGVLTCEMKDIPLVLGNTHLITDFEFDLSKKNTITSFVQKQTAEVAGLVNKLSQQKQDVIIAGDFNTAKDRDIYKGFLQKTNATDLFATETFPTYYHDRIGTYFHGENSARIDYIFLKNNLHKIKPHSLSHLFNETYTIAQGQKSYLSDHIGLHCVLEFSR